MPPVYALDIDEPTSHDCELKVSVRFRFLERSSGLSTLPAVVPELAVEYWRHVSFPGCMVNVPERDPVLLLLESIISRYN